MEQENAMQEESPTDNLEMPPNAKHRRLNRRHLRRVLASRHPSDCHPQLQSPLFSLLPPEIRFLIFTHALSQVPSRPISINSLAPLHRPGHTHLTGISTALLSTCRLIYYEAHAIPQRSATHHFTPVKPAPGFGARELQVHHVSSQDGAEVYHVHDMIDRVSKSRDFERFLLPHLCWKKITWTIPVYVWPAHKSLSDPAHHELNRVADVLRYVVVPSSCKEVVLEFEVRDDWPVVWWETCLGQAEKCRGMALKRRDGVEMAFDDAAAVEYVWMGSGQWPGPRHLDDGAEGMAEHRVLRVVWRAPGVKRREYMSYDCMDCLCLDGFPGVVVKPFNWASSTAKT